MAAPCPSTNGSLQAPEAICGEIYAVDFFEQTLTLEHQDGRIETVPFSRWTDFFRIARSKSSQHRETVDPTELEIGDQVQVRLDANGATAERVQVLRATDTRAAISGPHLVLAVVPVQ